MKRVLILGGVASLLIANETYIESSICKNCHPLIYKELKNSQHNKTSIYGDKIHKAIWNLHPKKANKNYSCGKCHTPSDSKLMNKLKNGKGVPEANKIQKEDPISCSTCHSIKDIKEHTEENSNIYNNEKKIFYSSKTEKIYREESYFFGLFKKTTGSPFHNIKKNEIFANGKVCIGCHSHKKNSKNFTICSIDNIDYKAKNSCITCHMPKVEGSATTIKKTKTHYSHTFAGVHKNQNLMKKYLKIDFQKKDNGFEISLKNEANHPLLMHPLRVGVLKVTIYRDGKMIKLKPKKFVRIIGDNQKPAFPWSATTILKDTMLKANENRVIKYQTELKPKDEVNIEFGYFLINPKVAKKLNLENDKVSKYKILKSKNIFIK